jgi:hypothetical protein
MRPHAARVLARRDVPLGAADYDWAARMSETVWAPPPASAPKRGCASNDGRLPAMVVLVKGEAFYADYECGPEDTSGQLSELTARADRIVAQRFPGIVPK